MFFSAAANLVRGQNTVQSTVSTLDMSTWSWSLIPQDFKGMVSSWHPPSSWCQVWWMWCRNGYIHQNPLRNSGLCPVIWGPHRLSPLMFSPQEIDECIFNGFRRPKQNNSSHSACYFLHLFAIKAADVVSLVTRLFRNFQRKSNNIRARIPACATDWISIRRLSCFFLWEELVNCMTFASWKPSTRCLGGCRGDFEVFKSICARRCR